jgi:hypothetical protein
MNWELFSPIGYVSIALWLCMPVLWLLHLLLQRRGDLLYVALLLGFVAMVAAKINSETYVNRIQVDRSEQIQEQLDRQKLAQQAATAAREEEVAPVRFAEDGRDDFLDMAGMDEADLKYLQSFSDGETPAWKNEKKKRSADVNDDRLETQIGATEDEQGVESDEFIEEEPLKPILMSDADQLAANRLDSANLTMIRAMILLGFVIVVVDYLRRANLYDQASFPLPLPSSWVDAMTPRDPVTVRSESPRRSLLDELRVFVRRGESFVYLTDDADSAVKAATKAYRLPLGWWPVEVLNVADFNDKMDDEFVFETLWYGRNSFVVHSSDRAERMLGRFVDLLSDRRATRARVKQTVHVVWDVDTPVSQETRRRFATVGKATGYRLLLCREESQHNA